MMHAMATAVPRLCAIVPTLDAIDSLPEVLAGVERWRVPIIVVDDGSTDGTRAWLEQWRDHSNWNSDGSPHRRTGEPEERQHNDSDPGAADRRAGARIVLARSLNGGKAMALRDGFARARELGFDAAVTIDADGQHDPADGARLIERFLAQGGTAIVCGVRDASTPGYPIRSLIGRRLNDLAIRAQTGVCVSDCPCGLRVYPLRTVDRVRCVSGRFAWEEEFLTRALWTGVAYESVPIRCIYAPHGARRSHYRFRRDWPEGIAVNLWLLVMALCPPAPTRRALATLVDQMSGAISLARARDQMVGDSPARLHGAASMAIGALGFGWWLTIGHAPPPSPSVVVLASISFVAAWAVIRLHGSLLLALGAGAIACAAASTTSGWMSGAAITAVAALVLAVPSIMALRRRAP